MSRNSGYLVETKTGLKGRTLHRDNLVGKKQIVYIEKEGREVKLLCDPKSLKIIGYVD
jgi:hypothetical protein